MNFELVHFFSPFILSLPKLCENNKTKNSCNWLRWVLFGRNKRFQCAFEEKEGKKNANFSCNVLSIHHFRVEHFIPLQFSHFTHTDFNIFYSFSYSIRRLLLCFNVSVIFFSSLSQIFLSFFRAAILLILQLFSTIHLISLKKLYVFVLTLIRKFRASNSAFFSSPKQTCNLWMHLMVHLQHFKTVLFLFTFCDAFLFWRFS